MTAIPARGFYLGAKKPVWLDRTDVPLFVSASELRLVKRKFPRARGPWGLDSGAFFALRLHGRHVATPAEYAAQSRRWAGEIGNLQFAAPQDWMCEPDMLRRTGLSVGEHQRRTTDNFRELVQADPGVPWVPVLQGQTLADYLRHADDYDRVLPRPLAAEPLVGLGSVCRRQATAEIEGIVTALHARGLKLHGFGVKRLGLERYVGRLASSDSMAWSREARWGDPDPGCPHGRDPAKPGKCNNCLRYALRWRAALVAQCRNAWSAHAQ